MGAVLDYGALRGATRTVLADAVPLPAPFTMYVEPTNVCNFACSYCPVSLDDYLERSGGRAKLDLAAAERVFSEILSLGRLRTLNLYMLGEPFANRALPEIIALAKRMDVADRVIVTSNGSLLDEAMAVRTIESGLDYLRFSIYGTTTEGFRAVTASRIPLERIVENVARLKRLRDARGARAPFLYAKMIDAGCPDENRRFLDLFGPLCDEAAVEPVMNWNLSEAEIDLSGRGGALTAGSYFARRKSACPFPFYTLVVNADLRVTVCCVDWEKATQVGDLNRQSLREIWGGDALRALRVKHLEGRRGEIAGCRSCTYLHTAPDSIDALSPQEFLRRSA